MSNPTRYRGQQGAGANAPNNQFGKSPAIWADCPWSDILNGHKPGVCDSERFLTGAIVAAGAEAQYGKFKGFASTGGSVAASGLVGGGRVFSSDGDNEGASLSYCDSPYKIIRTAGKLWSEFTIRTSTTTDTKNGFFFGLWDTTQTLSATVPIAAAGTLADVNFVGFHRLEGDGDQIDIVYKADGVTQVTVLADALGSMPTGSGYTALTADTDFKFAMVFDPADFYLRFYCMGIELASKLIPTAAGTDFPNDIGLGPVFSLLNATGTTPGNATWRGYDIAQLAA